MASASKINTNWAGGWQARALASWYSWLQHTFEEVGTQEQGLTPRRTQKEVNE